MIEHFNNLLKTEPKEGADDLLRKAVLMHLLEGDYARINTIRENYPAQEFLHLLGKYDTMVPIDIDKLFGINVKRF